MLAFVSIPHSLAPKDDLNIMSPGCISRMFFLKNRMWNHWQNYFHHHVRMSDEFVSAKGVCRQVERSQPSEHGENITCMGALKTSYQLDYKWNIPLGEWLLEKALHCFTNNNTSSIIHFFGNLTLGKHSGPNAVIARLRSLYFPIWKMGTEL